MDSLEKNAGSSPLGGGSVFPPPAGDRDSLLFPEASLRRGSADGGRAERTGKASLNKRDLQPHSARKVRHAQDAAFFISRGLKVSHILV